MNVKELRKRYRTIEVIIGLSLIFIFIVLCIHNVNAISLDTIKQDKQNEEKIVYIFPVLNISTSTNNQTYYLFGIVNNNLSIIDLNGNFTEIKIGNFTFSKKAIIPIKINENITPIETIKTISPNETLIIDTLVEGG